MLAWKSLWRWGISVVVLGFEWVASLVSARGFFAGGGGVVCFAGLTKEGRFKVFGGIGLTSSAGR